MDAGTVLTQGFVQIGLCANRILRGDGPAQIATCANGGTCNRQLGNRQLGNQRYVKTAVRENGNLNGPGGTHTKRPDLTARISRRERHPSLACVKRHAMRSVRTGSTRPKIHADLSKCNHAGMSIFQESLNSDEGRRRSCTPTTCVASSELTRQKTGRQRRQHA